MPSVPGKTGKPSTANHAGDAIGMRGGERPTPACRPCCADEHGMIEVLVVDQLVQVLLEGIQRGAGLGLAAIEAGTVTMYTLCCFDSRSASAFQVQLPLARPGMKMSGGPWPSIRSTSSAPLL
jgi:hypothetical protein